MSSAATYSRAARAIKKSTSRRYSELPFRLKRILACFTATFILRTLSM